MLVYRDVEECGEPECFDVSASQGVRMEKAVGRIVNEA